MECVPHAGEPGGMCSGRGFCQVSNDNLTAACVCEYPFASVGDFATDPSVDCSIHFTATRALWGICAGLYSIALASNVRFIIMSSLRPSKSNSKNKQQLKLKLVAANILVCCCIIATGVLEASASYPGERSIGIDVLTTTTFAMGSNAFWITSAYFNSILIKTSLKQMVLFSDDQHRSQVWAVQLLTKWMYVLLVMCITACTVVFDFLGKTGYDQVFAGLHYFILGFALSTNAVIAHFAVTPLIHQIDHVLTNSTNASVVQASKLRVTRKNFADHRRNMSNQAVFQAIVAFLFGAVPMITRKSAYWLPCAWSGGAFVIVELVKTWIDTSAADNSASKAASSTAGDRLATNGGGGQLEIQSTGSRSKANKIAVVNAGTSDYESQT